MKTVQEPTNSAQTVRTVTTRQVLPANSLPLDQKAPDFWGYVENLEKTPEIWERHLLYLYRLYGDNTDKGMPIDKISRYLTMPDKSQVPVGNREEFEFALQQKYGGGTYRLILKKGSEWVAQERIRLEGPPKPIVFESTAPTIGPMSESSAIADVAKTSMQMVNSQQAESVNIGVNALRNAGELQRLTADVITRLAASSATAQPSETDLLMKQAMVVMLQKALNPPDPLEQIKQIAAVVQLFGGNGNGANPLIQKFVDSAIERAMNPAPGGPAVSATAEIVRQLPQIANYAAEAIREWRVGSEAQRDTALIMTGKTAPQPAALAPGGATVATNPAIPSAQTPIVQPGAPQMDGSPTLEWIERKIIEILTDAENTPEESADETIGFLARMNPILLEQLVAAKPEGVMQLFNLRPQLRPALQNLPKLQEFIKAFFKLAAEWNQPEPGAAGTNGEASKKPN